MKVLIVGTGAVGGYYGARLLKARHEVVFLARGKMLAALRKGGLLVKSGRKNIRLKVKARERLKKGETFDLILICVKTYQTAAVLPQLRQALHDTTIVVSLQNGVRQHLPLIDAFGKLHVVKGLTYLGASVEAPGVIRHVAAGRIVLGELEGPASRRLREIAAAFQKAKVPCAIPRDFEKVLWEKLVWNVGFNGTTAITDLTVGEILKRPEQRVLIESAMRETVEVGRAQGIPLAKSLPKFTMLWSGRKGPDIETSMLWDRRRDRPLEWRIFQGFISTEGRRLGIPTPANDLIGRILESLGKI